MSEPVLSIRELETHLYSREGTIRPVNRVSFDIHQGETLGIVGESGSGKTMTALSIMGLIPKNLGGVVGGSVVLDGEDLAKMTDTEVRRRRSTKMGMIFQDPATSLNPTMKVGPQIAETMKTHLGINDSTARSRAIELLDRVGIPSPESRYNNYPFQFSGGMRQRVMIAIALSCDPLLLIADEPTTALDVTIQAQLLDFVREIKEERGMSVMWITHDLGVVAELCDQVAVMYAGSIVERASVDDIFARPKHRYTSMLLNSMPSIAERTAGRLMSIKGLPPNLANLREGCPFAVRCNAPVERWTAERNLLSCMNPATPPTGAGGAGGASGNATSTPPLPPGASGAGTTPSNPQYGSFSDILANYTGDEGTELDGKCSALATTMFDEIQTLVPTKLAALKSTDTDYAALLDIPSRDAVIAKVGRSELLKLYAGVLSYEAKEQESGASGANGGAGVTPDQGFDCIPDDAEDPGNLHLKVDVVNCLVFRTPHSWWVSNADRLRQRMQYSYFKAGQGTVGPINWLGYENWSCTASPDGPVVPCQRHDLAYDSLQKFAGRNPENTPGGTPIGNELDQSWHPRNKSLADSKFFADINHYGCENRNGLFASAMCGTLSNWANAVIYHFFVADGNDRGWPVTDEDLADGGGPKEELDAESSEYKYIVCGNPVPRIANLSIEQVVGTGFDVSWNFEEGCVDDIAISDIEICLILKHGASVLKACRDGLTTSTTSKRFNIVSRQWRGIHFPIIGVEVKISPTNVSYGPDEYKQYWRRYPVRVR